MRILFKILIATIAIMLTAWLLPGVHVIDVKAGIFAAIVLGILNAILRPILIFLTLPATILTLGLFILVINAGIVMLADYFLDGFAVEGFWWALLFSIVQWIVVSMLSSFEPKKTKPATTVD